MQSENQLPTTRPKKFFGLLVTGVLLLVVGRLFWRETNLMPAQRSWIGHTFEAFIFFSPVMLVLGAAMTWLGVVRFIRKVTAVDAIIPPHLAARFGKAWRIFVWVVTGVTIYPWWWMGILDRLDGRRPGNEGTGMAGFLMALFMGLPALALAIFNEVRIRTNRN